MELKNNWQSKLSIWIANNPKRSLLFSFIIILIFFPGLGLIKSQWSPRIWFNKNHYEIKKLNQFEKMFGSDQYISIGIHNPKGIFNNKSLEKLKSITKELWLISDVTRVEALANYNYVQSKDDEIIIEPFLNNKLSPEQLRIRAIQDEVLPDVFISKDTSYTILYGYLRPSIERDPNFKKIVKETRELIKKYEADDFKIYMTGAAAGNDAFREVSKKDNLRLIPVMILFMLIVLYLQFRTFITLINPILLMAISVGVTFGLMGELGLLYNSMLAAIPGVLLAICLADAVHILASYYIFKKDYDKKEAMIRSLYKNATPTLLTSISTIISFLSITVTEIAPIKHLGYLCSFGTMMAWVFTYFFLAPLTLIFDEDKQSTVNIKKTLFVINHGLITEKIDHHKKMICVFFIIFSLSSIFIAIQNEVNSDPIKYFHDSVPVRKAYHFTSEKMNGLRGIEYTVDSGKKDGMKDPSFLKSLDTFSDFLIKDGEVTRVRTVIQVIKNMNKVLNNNDQNFYKIPDTKEEVAQLLLLYTIGLPAGSDINNLFSLDNRYLRMRLTWNIENSKESLDKSLWIEKKAKEFGLNLETGGNAPIYLAINSLVVESFFSSIAMALILVSVLLYLVYKDLFISALAILPNIIPLTFGGALMYLMQKPIDIGTSLVCTVCLGIAVDDTIHFISSYKQSLQMGLNQKLAIENAFKMSSRALVLTTILLVGGFGSFAFADFNPNRNFGILCAFVLSFALLTDLVFLPALLLIVKKDKTFNRS